MRTKSHENENLLAKGVGNSQYMPVWADEHQTSYAPHVASTHVVRTG
jgi:hypothetical protein